MKLGLALPWANPRVALPLERVIRAERLGYDSVWTAEIYGQDAITPLAFLAAHTQRLRLGTAVIQTAARTPAAPAGKSPPAPTPGARPAPLRPDQ